MRSRPLTGPGATFTERLAVVTGAAVVLRLSFFREGCLIFPFASGSNGVFFDEAYRVLQGEVMYRDFFEFLMPGTPYLYAAVFALLGPTTGALGNVLVALGALLAALTHALSSRVAGPRWRLLPAAAIVALVYAPGTLGDHKWPALAAGQLGLIVLCAGPLSLARAAAGGALIGSSLVFTQDLGVGIAAGAAAGLAARRPGAKALAVFAVGCAAVPVAVLVFFAREAGLATLIENCVVFPLTRYREFNVFSVSLALTPRSWPRELAQLVLAAAGVWGAITAWRRDRRSPAALLGAAGVGMLLATAHRGMFPAMLAVQSSLLLPLAARALEAGFRAGAGGWLARASLLVIGVGLLHGSVGFAAWRQRFQPLTLEEHRAGTVWVATPMPELTWLEGRTAPGDAVFLLPARGGHYFLSHLRNATSFPYLIEGQSAPEHGAAALAQILAAAPSAGLWDVRPGGAAPPAGPVLVPLREGLLRRYEANRLPSGILALRERERESGAGGWPADDEQAARDDRVGVIQQEPDAPPRVVEEPQLPPQLEAPRHVLAASMSGNAGKHGGFQEQPRRAPEQPARERLAVGAARLGQQYEELPEGAVESADGAPRTRAAGRGFEGTRRGFEHPPEVHVAHEGHAELVDRQRERVIGQRVGIVETEHGRARPRHRDAPGPQRLVVDAMPRPLDEAVVHLDQDLSQAQDALVVGGQPRRRALGEEPRQPSVQQTPADGVDAPHRNQNVDVLHRTQPGLAIEPPAVVGSLQQDDRLVAQVTQQRRQRVLQELGTPAVEMCERGVGPQRPLHRVGQCLGGDQQGQQAFALGLPHQTCRRGLAAGRPGLAGSQRLHQGPERRGQARVHGLGQSTTAAFAPLRRVRH
jgi:hypothetical protein